MSLFKIFLFFKTSEYGNSSHYIIDFKNLSGSEHLSGLNDLNRPNTGEKSLIVQFLKRHRPIKNN